MAQSLNDINPQIDAIIPRTQQDLLARDIQKAIRVVDNILSSSNDELHSRNFLLNCFHEYGIPKMNHEFWNPWARYMNESGFGALQVSTELVDCLCKLITLNIETAVEIGVFRGGLSYFMTAVLQRARPDFCLTMVDPYDSLLGFEEFSRKLNMTKIIPSTSNDFVGQAFDLVFIDGDHTYEGALLDYKNLGIYATKALAFHDIHDHTPEHGTVRAWDDIKSELCWSCEVLEFAHAVPRGLGIGLAVRLANPTRRLKRRTLFDFMRWRKAVEDSSA